MTSSLWQKQRETEEPHDESEMSGWVMSMYGKNHYNIVK